MAGPITIPLHPDLAKYRPRYERIRVLIEEDEMAYETSAFMLPMPNEGANARTIKKPLFRHAFRNISLEIISAVKDSIFKEPIRLELPGEEKNPLWEFVQDVTRGGDDVPLLQYAKDICTLALRAYGMIWTVIDKPDYQATNFQDELINGKPYINNISPLNVRNFSVVNGELEWFAYDHLYRPIWADPTKKTPVSKKQIRIWTKESFHIVEEGQLKETFKHNFGFVPVVYQAFFLPIDTTSIIGITPFFASSRYIIWANNVGFVGDFEITKHGNSVLLAHENALSSMSMQVTPEGEPVSKLQDARGLNMFVWNGEHKPEYLVKDLESVDKSSDLADDYFKAAVDNERSMRSVLKKGVGGHDVAESGIAKMVDMAPIMAGLRATSEDLQSWCIKVLDMVARIMDVEPNYTCEFPRKFDIGMKMFEQQLDEIVKMKKVSYPSEIGMKEKYKALTPGITQNTDKQAEIDAEVDAADVSTESMGQLEREIDADINIE